MQYEPNTSSSNLYQALTEKTGQAYFAYNTASKHFTYLSPAFEHAFQVKQEDLNNPKGLLARIHPEDQSYVAERYRDLLAGKAVGAFEFRIAFSGRAEQWVCVTPSLLYDAPDKPLVIGHAENITTQKQANDVLKKFSNKKNAILNILSHDLAGPLANIQHLASLLAEEKAPQSTGDSLHILSIIEQSSKQAIQLIQDFVAQEFLETSEVEATKRRVNIVEKIQDAMTEYQKTQNELVAKTFHFAATANEIYTAVDDNKFIQVINNLLSNALKFTPDGGTISVSIEDRQEHVRITVADNGVGIPAKYHTTLFDKFTNARRPGLKGEPSTGLGMFIIKTIVEWHNGQIWFESEEGKGTTFYIEIPKE